jgi:hypothetical protein
MKNNCSPKKLHVLSDDNSFYIPINYLKNEDDYGFFCIIDRDDIEFKTNTITQNSMKKSLKKKYIDYINEKWNKEYKKCLENKKNNNKITNNYLEYCKINNVENNKNVNISFVNDDYSDDDDDDEYKKNFEKINLFIKRIIFSSFVLLVGVSYFITVKYYYKK